MILTVTINPLLERRYYFDEINLSKVNRGGKLIIKAGGKGINVNRQLNKLGIANSAMLFTGGSNGKLFRDALGSEKINFSDFTVKSESRDAAIIVDESSKKIFSFFGTNPSVTTAEVNNFILKMEKAIAICEVVVFSGSSPNKEAEKIFVEGIAIANKLDKISVCDTYGEHLEQCLDASPTIVHNNVDEIRASLNINMEKENNYTELFKTLYNKGTKQAYVTNSGGPFYASNFDFHYKITPPEISTVDSTGSGDAFVAGIIYGWHNKLNFEEQVCLATGLGVCNAASLEVCEVKIEDARLISGKVLIKPVGKKMKQIDDSPF